MKRNTYRTLEELKASSLWNGLSQPVLPKDTRVYKSTRLEDMIYDDLRNLDDSLDALETQDSEKLDAFPSLIRDMFQAFYSLNPRRNNPDSLTANGNATVTWIYNAATGGPVTGTVTASASSRRMGWRRSLPVRVSPVTVRRRSSRCWCRRACTSTGRGRR